MVTLTCLSCSSMQTAREISCVKPFYDKERLLFLSCLLQFAMIVSLSSCSARLCTTLNESSIACDALYSRTRWQSYFQPSRKQGQSYLLRTLDRGRLDIADLSRTWLLAKANPSLLLHCLWGHLARGGWNWEANVARCLHLALSSTAKFPGQRLSPVYNL